MLSAECYELKSTTAAAAKAAAGEAAAGKASTAPAGRAGTGTRSGDECCTGRLGHGANAVDEVKRIEHAYPAPARRLIPGGRVLHDPFEGLGPAVLHAKGHGIWQEFLESIGGHAL